MHVRRFFCPLVILPYFPCGFDWVIPLDTHKSREMESLWYIPPRVTLLWYRTTGVPFSMFSWFTHHLWPRNSWEPLGFGITAVKNQLFVLQGGCHFYTNFQAATFQRGWFLGQRSPSSCWVRWGSQTPQGSIGSWSHVWHSRWPRVDSIPAGWTGGGRKAWHLLGFLCNVPSIGGSKHHLWKVIGFCLG